MDTRAVVPRSVVRAYLEQAGYEVLTAADGEQTLRLVRQERPGLVVLDVMLPKRDGWEITRRIRADPTTAATPIILLTARVDDVDKILGLELGADDYITKPFNAREVVARVRALLRRSQLNQEQGGSVTVVGRREADTICLAVRDTGAGLEAEQLEWVFERFYRADKSRSRDTGGTGLGLAIVKAIVEAHDGQVVVESDGPSC